MMKIGNITFGPQPVFLAPMEDVTDIGFRLLCKRFGASMVYTEFVSAEALVRSVRCTLNKLVISDEERPVGIQLYGRDQDCGISALTIHGRTRSQMYTGQADWEPIGAVKRNPRIHIPIIGNGDITSPEEAKAAFERFGVDAVMVGRATFGRPWIFREIRRLLDGEPADPDMDFAWKLGILEEQLRINVERIDEYRGILHTRRHLAASPIFKGIPNFRPTRIAMLRAERLDELKAILDELRRNPPQPITT